MIVMGKITVSPFLFFFLVDNEVGIATKTEIKTLF